MIGIYSITNKKTGQMYIGQSTNIEKRFQEHIRGKDIPNSRIDNAIQKYGEDYFKFEIIEEFDKDTPFLDDVLNDSEQYYIAAYNTFQNDFHYNLTIGGDGVGFGENHPCYGKPLTEEHKKKISESLSGENNPNYGNPNNYHHSEETKKKISKAKSGENHHFYGKHHSEETKQKISKTLTGRCFSKESKEKMSENHWDNSGENHPMYGKTGENNPGWKNYARIIKAGKKNNKQQYAIKYQGRKIKQSISIDKLSKWFSKNYTDKELRCEIE